MFSMPQLYGAAEDRLQCILPEEVAVCKEECTPKGQYPCDETVFELCVLLMGVNGWSSPVDAYSAVELYSLLRNEILHNGYFCFCTAPEKTLQICQNTVTYYCNLTMLTLQTLWKVYVKEGAEIIRNKSYLNS